jgi:hypothetical protein
LARPLEESRTLSVSPAKIPTEIPVIEIKVAPRILICRGEVSKLWLWFVLAISLVATDGIPKKKMMVEISMTQAQYE